MKIACISDTHRFHRQIIVPKCDVVVFAGDAGWEDWIGGYQSLLDFMKWYGSLNAKFKLFIPGNHDWLSVWDRKLVEELAENNGIYYLIDDWILIENIKFYLSPWSKRFCGWAWNLPENEDLIIAHWNKIPANTNVVITHSMPYEILDKTIYGDEHVGDEWLLERLKVIKPKLYVGGHLHFQGGQQVRIDDTLYVNASVCNEQYEPINKIQIIEI